MSEKRLASDQVAAIPIDFPNIRSTIQQAEVVFGIDETLEEQVLFYGREVLEQIIKSGVPREVYTARVKLNLNSIETEQLSSLLVELKGQSLYSLADRFPEIVIDPSNAPRELFESINKIVTQVRQNHLQLIPDAMCAFFHMARDIGFPQAFAELYEMRDQVDSKAIPLIAVTLGELIQRESLDDWIQPNRCLDVKFGEPSETQILIRFRSLRTHSSQRHGISYYSPNKPTFYCKADRKNRIVSFSRHALERIHERTVYNWKTYSGSGAAFAFINNCIYYENCIESQSDQYLVIYNRCTEGFVSYNFLENVIEDFDFNKQYYYRVGYCPIVLDGKFVKAKTFLVPGMRGTPERKLLQSLPLAQQISIEAQIESQLSFHSLVDSGNWTLIKWFHEQGVPQVKSFNLIKGRFPVPWGVRSAKKWLFHTPSACGGGVDSGYIPILTMLKGVKVASLLPAAIKRPLGREMSKIGINERRLKLYLERLISDASTELINEPGSTFPKSYRKTLNLKAVHRFG